MKEVAPGQVWQDGDVIVVTLYPRPDIDAANVAIGSEWWRLLGAWQCLVIAHEPNWIGWGDLDLLDGVTIDYCVADPRSGWRRLI
jgi:hypothetical protein